VKWLWAVVLAVHLPGVCAAANSEWTLVRSPHFEVYSQAGERDGQSALLRFEQLRAFFAQVTPPHAATLLNDSSGAVRIIRFQSQKEYAAFRLRPAADAYFLSGGAVDYIVMPRLGSEDFPVAAHEYAHLVLHSLGLRLPVWLAEGVGEFFSSLRIDEQRCLIGGDLPMHTQTLRQRRWLPLSQLLTFSEDSQLRTDRNEAAILYAESWALTNMLIFSPAYASRFSELLDATAGGSSDAATIVRIYGKPLNAITNDLRAWVRQPHRGVPLPGVPNVKQDVRVSELTSFDSQRMMADLLLAAGDFERAETAYRELEDEQPNDPAIAAALGTIALRKGDRAGARAQWKRAMALGIRDAALCYQYANLAEDAGERPDEIRAALERAIELKPDFDDARFKLGLFENNRGQYGAALGQFRAMRVISSARAYAYWTAVASALTETDQREQAKDAADKAKQYATTADERSAALELRYAAGTDLTVQLSRDAKGNLQMVTARKPHGSNDWNPFVEPSDNVVSLEGQIRRVECSAGTVTGFRVENRSTAVKVLLPDPTHVLIRGGTPEFVCGAEDGRKVEIEYAAFAKHEQADGILRGMQFR
jgi:tetratricopeptide (TPR) repeat protein